MSVTLDTIRAQVEFIDTRDYATYPNPAEVRAADLNYLRSLVRQLRKDDRKRAERMYGVAPETVYAVPQTPASEPTLPRFICRCGADFTRKRFRLADGSMPACPRVNEYLTAPAWPTGMPRAAHVVRDWDASIHAMP